MINQLYCRTTCDEKPIRSNDVPAPGKAQHLDASPSERPALASSTSSGFSRWAFLLWSAVFAVLILGGGSQSRAEQPSPIKVGFIVPEQGELASEAKSFVAGFELFLKEKGKAAPPLEILKRDCGANDAKTLEAVTDLAINKEVTFLIGPPTLEGSEKAIEGTADAKTIVFVTSAAVRLVAGELCSPKIFRVRPNAYQAARPLAPWALKKAGRKVFITGDDDPLGNAEADFFAQGFEKSGGMFVDRVMVPTASDTMKSILSAIEKAKPDFVFASFRGPRAVAFLKAYQATSPRLTMPVIGPESLTGFPQTLAREGKHCVGVRTLTTFKNPQELVAQIKEKVGQEVTDASRAAEGYDVAAIICSAASAIAGDTDPAKLIEAIQRMEIQGPRGKLSFDANHEPVLEVMVQEWAPDGKGFKQTILDNLGAAKSLDFGCGRVGFPRRPQNESKEEALDEPKGEEMIWEDESQ